MPRTIRYHLDEHCPSAIALGLRRHGIDATTAAEAGLLSASDEDHVRFALAEGRVIYTQDDDFLSLNARNVNHAGIAGCPQHSRSIGEVLRALVLIWEVYDPSELVNRVEYL